MWNPTHVQVTVHRAKGLASKGKNGTNDTYVTIHLGKDKYQTSVKEKSKNPEWHEECDLLIPDKATDIHLNAYHRNLLGLDQFLGHVALPLNEFQIYDRPRSRWYTLRNKPESKKPEKNRGEIEVKVTFIVQSVASASSTKSSLSSSTMSLNKLGKITKPSAIKSLAHSVGDRLKHPTRGKSERRHPDVVTATPYLEPPTEQNPDGSTADSGKVKTKSFTPTLKEEPASASMTTEASLPDTSKLCRTAPPIEKQLAAQSMLNLSTVASNVSIGSNKSAPATPKVTEVEVKRESKFSGSALLGITRREAPHVDDAQSNADEERVSRIISPVKEDQSEQDIASEERQQSDHSLYARGRFTSEPPESVRKSLCGETTSPLRIVAEETVVAEPPSPPPVATPGNQQEYWSSSTEERNAMNTTRTSAAAASPGGATEPATTPDETKTTAINGPTEFPMTTTSMPMSAMPESPLDFRRLKKTKGDDFRRHTLHYGVRETPKAPAHALYQGITEYKRNADEEHAITDAMMAPYELMSKEELIRLVCGQKQREERDAAYIGEMENYLDSLLVKVIETAPKILQNPYNRRASPPLRAPAKGPAPTPPKTVAARPPTGQTVVPPPPTTTDFGNNRAVPPRVTTHSRKVAKPVALKNSKKAITNPFKKISAALK